MLSFRNSQLVKINIKFKERHMVYDAVFRGGELLFLIGIYIDPDF